MRFVYARLPAVFTAELETFQPQLDYLEGIGSAACNVVPSPFLVAAVVFTALVPQSDNLSEVSSAVCAAAELCMAAEASLQ